MKASTLARTARLRSALTQRELAARTRISQPMISLIESGLQDPRYSTLQRILDATDHELELFPKAGRGVDRTQFAETLRLTPDERIVRGAKAARWLKSMRGGRRL